MRLRFRLPSFPLRMYIWLLVVICVVAFSCLMGLRVLMSLFALELGASPLEVGVLMGSLAVFPLILAVSAGRVIDRFGNGLPIVGGVGTLGLSILIPYFLPNLPALYVTAVLIGMSTVFFTVSVQHLVSAVGPVEERTRNVSMYSIAMATSSAVGPIGTGLVIDAFGHRATYLVLAMVLIILTVLGLFHHGRIPRGEGPGAARKEGAFALLQSRPLRLVLVIASIAVMGVDLFAFYMPIYGHAINLSATMIGVVLGAQGLASLMVRALLPRLIDRWGEEVVMSGALTLAAVSFLAFPFFEAVALLIPLAFLLGLGLGCGQPLSLIMVAGRAPRGRGGEALGLRFAFVNVMHIGIPVAFGSLSTAVGLAPVFASAAGILVTGSYLSSRIRRLDAG